MKAYRLIIVASSFAMATLGYLPAHAQQTGLYSTVNDFQQQKVTYPVDCNNHQDKLKLNDFWGSSTGYVISNSKQYPFKKDEVYGYRTCENENYRFYHKESFLIKDTAGFFIYYQCKNVVQPSGKGMIKSDLYYFSTSGDSPLYPLTIENLKKAYPTNIPFHYALEAYFKSDRQLIQYDEYAKRYKVKYIYLQSVK